MDLAAYLTVLRRRLLPALLCLLAGIGGGYYKGHSTPPVYQATARALVNLPNVQSGVQESLAGAQLSGSFLGTYAKIATSRSVAQKVITSLGLKESPGALQGRLSAQVEAKTFLIDISAKDGDPTRAKLLADATASALGERVVELERGKPVRIQAQLLDEAAVPRVPFSPKPRSDLLLGLMLGLVVAVCLIVLLEALDRTIKATEQGDNAFQAPLLGLVPRRRRGSALVVAPDETDPASEPYRILRTAVQFSDPDHPVRTILITSAGPGEGKTTTAANLALAFAAAGERVAVVDGDLRRAALAQAFGLEDVVGIASLVRHQASLSDALQPWAANIVILPAGRPLPPNPSEVLGSQFFTNLIETLADMADVVIIDTPPVLPVTDAVALAAHVDAVVLVARHGRTLRSNGAEARRRLDAVGARIAGYVLNAVPHRDSRGYYADYRYAYAPPGSARPQRDSSANDREVIG